MAAKQFFKNSNQFKDRFLVFDMGNMLYRSFYANPDEDDMVTAGLAHHRALTVLNKYFKQFRPTKVFMAFDRPNWRKVYTKTDECVTWKVYKGNRRQNLTPKQQAKYEKFLEHVTDFEELMKEHTSVICVASKLLEADDLIAGISQKFEDEAEVVIISSDKDLMQLLTKDNVVLINPDNGKERTLEDFDNDPNYFIFEKCFRGDRGDNVQNARPRIRTAKIKEAYKDPFIRENIMHETWTNELGKEVVVGHIFKENNLLMNLSAQPDMIRKKMDKTIDDAINDPGTFSYFHFMKFCGEYELKKISENIHQYTKMLSR